MDILIDISLKVGRSAIELSLFVLDVINRAGAEAFKIAALIIVPASGHLLESKASALALSNQG